jgi:hypothetical protein
MLPMTSPPAETPIRRFVLVPSDPPAERTDGVRRFRLARLRLEERDVPAGERFSHLKRQYD